jgi:hypothetical protein
MGVKACEGCEPRIFFMFFTTTIGFGTLHTLHTLHKLHK